MLVASEPSLLQRWISPNPAAVCPRCPPHHRGCRDAQPDKKIPTAVYALFYIQYIHIYT